MNVTSASPIISAAAVAAVRPGLLRAFSPESLSVAGSERTSGRSLAKPPPRTALTTWITSQMTSATSVTATAAAPK